jgi:hypothetical protein
LLSASLFGAPALHKAIFAWSWRSIKVPNYLAATIAHF